MLIKDEREMFRTFNEKLPNYMKQMDKKKQKEFRGSIPVRYHADLVSLSSLRSRSLAGAGTNVIARNGSVAPVDNKSR